METFQILMSSISVRDSQLSIEQSQRATRLTQLAFIYVPLSFVTGIFGMNVQEISATGLSIWVCFVTLAIIVILGSSIPQKQEEGARGMDSGIRSNSRHVVWHQHRGITTLIRSSSCSNAEAVCLFHPSTSQCPDQHRIKASKLRSFSSISL